MLAERIAKKAKEDFGYTCFNGFCMIVMTEGQLANLIAVELEASQQEWAKALVDLTPGGSEYVGDPAKCAAFIHCKEAGLIAAMKRFKERAESAQRQAMAECALLLEHAALPTDKQITEWRERESSKKLGNFDHDEEIGFCHADLCADKIRALIEQLGEEK